MLQHLTLLAVLAGSLAVPVVAATGEPGPLTTAPGERAVEPVPASLGPIPPITFADRVMEIVNDERLANGGLVPLKRNSLLDISSHSHSQNMGQRNFHMHCDPDTLTSPGNRIAAAGYSASTSAENIAAGYGTPEAVMAGWMSSSGHRANILSTTRRELGIGYFLDSSDTGNVRITTTGGCTPTSSNNGPYQRYWTQNFGTRTGDPPLVVIERERYQTSSPFVTLYLKHPGSGTMQLSNNGSIWSPPLPVASARVWVLSGVPGLQTVWARFSANPNDATDTIYYSGLPLIFADGFDSGTTATWSLVLP